MSHFSELIRRRLAAGRRCYGLIAVSITVFLLAGVAASAQPQRVSKEPTAEPAPDPHSQETASAATKRDPTLIPGQAQAEKAATSVNIFTGLGSTSADGYKPLTGKQRWQYYVNQNFASVGAFLGPVLSAGLDQVNAQPPEWGGGVKGYSERLASRLGTGIVQGTAQSIGCAFLGQEPRYIRSANSGTLHRIGHAFLFSLITYNNDGKKRIAFATIGSYYVGSIATDAWLPARYSALGDGVRDGNRQVILAGLVNQFQEFWPEIKHYIFRKQ